MKDASLQGAEIAREEVLAECKRSGLTLRRTLKRIAEGLDAKEVKTHFDTDTGKWSYSRKLIAHKTRLEAVSLAVAVLGAKPSEKHDVNVTGNINLFDRLQEARERASKRPKE